MGLYVETRVRVGMDELWDRTQRPEHHRRWDLRFTRIDPLPPDGGPEAPRRFRYATRLLPGLTVSGTGIAAGERHRPDGTRTSALRFSSSHPLSFLAEGRGYWRYVPDGDAVRFLTGYDYRPRWGRVGAVADRRALRPLMGWATAWSFDRLRLWCERGVGPARALLQALGEAAVRVGAAAAAGAAAGTAAAVLTAAACLLLPPLPTTPAARRCLRRPPGRRPAAPPALLDALEPPR